MVSSQFKARADGRKVRVIGLSGNIQINTHFARRIPAASTTLALLTQGKPLPVEDRRLASNSKTGKGRAQAGGMSSVREWAGDQAQFDRSRCSRLGPVPDRHDGPQSVEQLGVFCP